MSRGKADFLRSLQSAVVQQKKLWDDTRFALDYLTRWQNELTDDPDHYDFLSWLFFFRRLESRFEAAQQPIDNRLARLSQDCGLDLSNANDRDLLLSALASTIYPADVGAKQKWADRQLYDLAIDIQRLEKNVEGRLSDVEAAGALIKSNPKDKYLVSRYGADRNISLDSLRKRVARARSQPQPCLSSVPIRLYCTR